jgi:hypothetical protein
MRGENMHAQRTNLSKAPKGLGRIVYIDRINHELLYRYWPFAHGLVFTDHDSHRLLQFYIIRASDIFSLFGAVGAYLGRFGKPIAFHLDNDMAYQDSSSTNSRNTSSCSFLQIMATLDIKIVFANPYSCGMSKFKASQIELLTERIYRWRGTSNVEINQYLQRILRIGKKVSSGNEVMRNVHRKLVPGENLIKLLGY